jgi:hypothetical protein
VSSSSPSPASASPSLPSTSTAPNSSLRFLSLHSMPMLHWDAHNEWQGVAVAATAGSRGASGPRHAELVISQWLAWRWCCVVPVLGDTEASSTVQVRDVGTFLVLGLGLASVVTVDD